MWIYWTLLIGANLPVYWFVSRVFFKDLDELGEAIGFLFTPELFSALGGAYWDDIWAETKLLVFVATCVVITHMEHSLLGETLMAMFGG
jgi:hypothetical protein